MKELIVTTIVLWIVYWIGLHIGRAHYKEYVCPSHEELERSKEHTTEVLKKLYDYTERNEILTEEIENTTSYIDKLETEVRYYSTIADLYVDFDKLKDVVQVYNHWHKK